MKILIDVFVPATGKVYNMWIPQETTVNYILEQIKKVVAKMHEDAFIPDENTVICLQNDGKILNVNMSIAESGIGNGSRLMLV